jgi:predicted SnoaL-like aldol condensation-catalyzing enzyme
MDQETISGEHRRFYEWFRSFWATPSGAKVAEKFLPHAQIHFTGAGTMSGASYADWIANLLASQPDLVVTPVDYAASGDLIYIFWTAASTIDGVRHKWHGVDRFRLENGMVVEEHVIFDSAALRSAA